MMRSPISFNSACKLFDRRARRGGIRHTRTHVGAVGSLPGTFGRPPVDNTGRVKKGDAVVAMHATGVVTLAMREKYYDVERKGYFETSVLYVFLKVR